MVRRSDVVPTDLFFVIWVDAGAERPRDQLSAEANPQHGEISAQGFFDQFHLDSQMRQPVRVVDAHRPAQNYQTVVTIQARLGVRMPREIDIADAEARPLQ